MGNCISNNNNENKSNISNYSIIVHKKINTNNENNECLICWNEITDPNRYVKCKNCKIYLHYKCITSFIIFNTNKFNSYNSICPHCQKHNVLYLFNYDECIKL
jgi:hypothetical protein